MNGPTLADMFLAIVPLVVVIGLAWFFIANLASYQKKMGELQRRQIEALERIAVALEKRANP